MSAPPSQDSPAGIPSSGNAKYAAFVVILLLGMGAILLWKFVLSKPDQPVAQPTPSVTPPKPSASEEMPTSKLNAVPPPPPIASSAPSSTPRGPAVAGGGGTGGCDAKCTGSAPGDLAGSLQVRASMARRCYQAALANDSSLKGRVTVAVKISPSGNVCSANVAQSDIPAISGCVAGVFRGGSFPAPRGGCVDTMVPMSFSPAQ
jgi:hypothetical protein